MSYANMLMYASVLPSYNESKKEDKNNEIIDADDPKNRDKILKILKEAK